MGDVLCYGFDPHDDALKAITDQIRQKAAANAEEVYEELLRRGYRFPRRQELLTATEGELRVAGDCANLLLKHGYVHDWPSALEMIRDAGYREMKADMAETVEVVHRSGGVALSFADASLSMWAFRSNEPELSHRSVMLAYGRMHDDCISERLRWSNHV
jgi:hypothetical protein